MKKTAVIYWSGTGNTEAMASAVAEGMRQAGAECSVLTSADVTADTVAALEAVALGCPAMGAEELEETEFAPMFDAVKSALAGKSVGLFGSYGWGDGEWMRSWEEDCLAAGAVLGGVLGAARAVLPTRGRAAFLPDMLFVGVALMALQSYAVSQSQAGQLRGYMALAAFCAAGAVQAALRPLFAAAEANAGKLLLGPVRLAARCIAPWKAARAAAKVRRNEKRLAKKQKKSLPTPRRMLYNSNVSK